MYTCNILGSMFLSPNPRKWSDEGLYTRVNGNEVECVASHLTSFAVLVDHQGIIDVSKVNKI